MLDGREYRLAANDGANALHGGRKSSVFGAQQIARLRRQLCAQ
jgi:galactose mutarotase-like enzyme